MQGPTDTHEASFEQRLPIGCTAAGRIIAPFPSTLTQGHETMRAHLLAAAALLLCAVGGTHGQAATQAEIDVWSELPSVLP